MEKIVLVHYVNTSEWNTEETVNNLRLYSKKLTEGKDYEYLINFILLSE